MKRQFRFLKKSHIVQVIFSLVILVTVASPVLPFLERTASALTAPDANASIFDIPSENPITAFSCQGYFTSAPDNAATLNKAFYDLGGNQINGPTDIASIPGLNNSQSSFLTNNWGKNIPIIQFAGAKTTPANGSVVGGEGSLNTASSASCNNYIMVDVSNANDDYIALSGTDANNGASMNEYTTNVISNDTQGTMNWNWSNIGACQTGPSGSGKFNQTTVCGFNAGQPKGGNGQVTAKDIGKITGSYSPFIVSGQPNTASAGPVSVGGITISWDNADQFTVASASGSGTFANGNGGTTTVNYANYKGEVYQKVYWGGTPASGLSYYFLQTAGTAGDTNRTTWGSGQGCSDPLPNGQLPSQASCGAAGNCVPFFAIQDDLDETDVNDNAANPPIDASHSSNNQSTNPGIAGLQAAIDGLATAPITFFDYTPDNGTCIASQPASGGSAITPAKGVGKTGIVGEANQGNSTIWLYYANQTKEDQFATVFTSSTSGSHETSFIGTYGKANGGTNLYEGPINGSGCSGQIQATPNQQLGVAYPVRFTLIDSSQGCNNTVDYGYIVVTALTVSDATFNGVATAGANNSANTPQSKDVCDNSPTLSFIDPFLCGIIHALAGTATGIDCDIGNFLKIDTNTIFNDTGNGGTNSQAGCTGSGAPSASALAAGSSGGSTAVGNAYYTAWQAFRDIAYAMLVIIFLIMIAAQILDLDTFNAYALRKMLPAAAVAIPLIALSWNGQDFLYNLSNDAYDAIRAILAAPFTHVNLGAGFTVGSDITLALLVPALLTVAGVGAVLLTFMDLGGIMMLVLAGVVAVFSAWIILIARTIVATFLIDWAPVAIMCAIYKPFRKGFDLWAALTAAILLSTPAVGAELQLSHDAAKVAFADGHAATAFIILIAGYALLWQILKLMDKAAGRMGDLAASATNAISKGAKKRARESLKYGMDRAVNGQDKVTGARSLLAGAVRRNRLSREGGWSSLFSPTKSGREAKRREYENAVIRTGFGHAKESLEQDNGREGGNDLNMTAAKDANTEGEFISTVQKGARKDIRSEIASTGSYQIQTANGPQTIGYADALGRLDREAADSNTTAARMAQIQQERSAINSRIDSEADTQSLDYAKNALAAVESSFGARIGSHTLKLAAYQSLNNSKTSYNAKGGFFERVKDDQGNFVYKKGTQGGAYEVDNQGFSVDKEGNRVHEVKFLGEMDGAQLKERRANGKDTVNMRGQAIEDDEIDWDYMESKITDDASELIREGIITTADAATIVKQRADQQGRSGIGHGLQQKIFNNAVARKNDAEKRNAAAVAQARKNGTTPPPPVKLDIQDVVSMGDLEEGVNDIIVGGGAGGWMQNRHETTRALVPVMRRQLREVTAQGRKAEQAVIDLQIRYAQALQAGDPGAAGIGQRLQIAQSEENKINQEIKEHMARALNALDVGAGSPNTNTAQLKKLLDEKIEFPDSFGFNGPIDVGKAGDVLRADDDVRKLRREWAQQQQQQQQQQQNQQQNQGGGNPNSTPPTIPF